MSSIKLDGITLANTANSKAVLDSGVQFPAGHMLRQFYDEHYFNGSPATISTTASNWSGLEITITNPNTSNYLFLQMFIPDVYAPGADRGLMGGFVYSTDAFSTESTLGTRSFYHAQQTYADSYGLASSTLLVRVSHPTNSQYSIRPYLKAYNNNMYIGHGANGNDSIATLFAMEIQG